MKIKQGLLFLFVFVFLSVNAFGQETKSKESLPDNVLFRQVELNLKDVTPKEAFWYLMMQEGVMIGGVDLEDNNTRQRVDFNIELPFRSMLDYILAFDTRYRWVEDKGVINHLPIEEPKILSVSIPKFKATKSNPRELVKELLKIKEVKDAAKIIGIEIGALYRFPNPHGGDEGSDEVEVGSKDDCINDSNMQSTEMFSVDIENLTVREILNEIARSYKSWGYAWKYSEKHFVDSDGNEKTCFNITVT